MVATDTFPQGSSQQSTSLYQVLVPVGPSYSLSNTSPAQTSIFRATSPAVAFTSEDKRAWRTLLHGYLLTGRAGCGRHKEWKRYHSNKCNLYKQSTKDSARKGLPHQTPGLSSQHENSMGGEESVCHSVCLSTGQNRADSVVLQHFQTLRWGLSADCKRKLSGTIYLTKGTRPWASTILSDDLFF